jgi:hypothetical protein
MLPLKQYYVIEAINITELNIKIRDLIAKGCAPYDSLKVIFYGKHQHEKIYVQTFVYKRRWMDFLLRREF